MLLFYRFEDKVTKQREAETMKKVKDFVNIAYFNTKEKAEHPVYLHEDLAQNALCNLVARNYQNPTTTLKYSMLNDYNRKIKPAIDRSKVSIELIDNLVGEQSYKTIDDKIFLKEFIAWLPTDEDRYVWNQYLYHDRTMSDIGKEIGKSKAVMSWYKIRLLQQYKTEVLK